MKSLMKKLLIIALIAGGFATASMVDVKIEVKMNQAGAACDPYC